jgi:hypothetical protein
VAKKKDLPKALYGVYRNGLRVYLPPKGVIGVELERAKQLQAGLPGSEIVCLYDPEREDAQAA